jgi:hypothetical protein
MIGGSFLFWEQVYLIPSDRKGARIEAEDSSRVAFARARSLLTTVLMLASSAERLRCRASCVVGELCGEDLHVPDLN